LNRWAGDLIAALPRLLSLQDRDPTSRTFGCFDRTWWCWKFTDLASPRAQEAVLPLAIALDLDHADNPCHGRAEVLGWIAAGLRFAERTQHRDGSFDEAYPNERSWGATAFVVAAMADTLDRVGPRLEPADRRLAVDVVGRGARFLAANDETHGFLANHRAAAIAALTGAHAHTGDAAHQRAAERIVAGLRAAASPEGWLPEYDGADPGYQSHALGFLATADRRGAGLADVLERGFGFLAWFVAPDGSFGGEYGSRSTSFWFPAGAAECAGRFPAAAALASRMATGRATGLSAMDQQNFVPMLASVAQAAVAPAVEDARALPTDGPARRWFPAAGLLVHATDRYVAVVSTRKGVVLANGRDGTGFASAGWVGGRATSQGPTPAAPEVRDDEVRLATAFRDRLEDVFDPWRFVAFRLVGLGPGRSPRVAGWIKRALVARLVTATRADRGRLERSVRFAPDGIAIDDRVTWDGALPADLQHVDRFTAIHMGSSRYWQPAELAAVPTVTVRTPAPGERATRVTFPPPRR
jgi:hypothetical protein